MSKEDYAGDPEVGIGWSSEVDRWLGFQLWGVLEVAGERVWLKPLRHARTLPHYLLSSIVEMRSSYLISQTLHVTASSAS